MVIGVGLVKDYILVIAPLLISLILLQREWDRYTLPNDNSFISGIGHLILLQVFFFYLYFITKMYLCGTLISFRKFAPNDNNVNKEYIGKMLTESAGSIAKIFMSNDDNSDDYLNVCKSEESHDELLENNIQSCYEPKSDRLSRNSAQTNNKERDNSHFDLTPIGMLNIMELYSDDPQFTISLLTAYQTFEYIRMHPEIRQFKHIVIAALFHNIKYFINKIGHMTHNDCEDISLDSLPLPVYNLINAVNRFDNMGESSDNNSYASLIKTFRDKSMKMVEKTPIENFKYNVCDIDIIYNNHLTKSIFDDNQTMINIKSYLPWIRDLDIVRKTVDKMGGIKKDLAENINNLLRDNCASLKGDTCNFDVDKLMKMMIPLLGSVGSNLSNKDISSHVSTYEVEPDHVNILTTPDINHSIDEDDTSEILEMLRIQREKRENKKRHKKTDDQVYDNSNNSDQNINVCDQNTNLCDATSHKDD